MITPRMGELLRAKGLVSEEKLRHALEFQSQIGGRLTLGSILLDRNLVTEEALLDSLSRMYGCPAVPWASLCAADAAVVRLLPASHAIRLGAFPYAAHGRVIAVAFSNPSNIAAVDAVAEMTGMRVFRGVTTEVRLMQAHHRFYGRLVPQEFRTLFQKLERKPEAGNGGERRKSSVVSLGGGRVAERQPALSGPGSSQAVAGSQPRVAEPLPSEPQAAASPIPVLDNEDTAYRNLWNTPRRIAPIVIPDFPMPNAGDPQMEPRKFATGEVLSPKEELADVRKVARRRLTRRLPKSRETSSGYTTADLRQLPVKA